MRSHALNRGLRLAQSAINVTMPTPALDGHDVFVGGEDRLLESFGGSPARTEAAGASVTAPGRP
jgi:hypothetical protein